MSTSTSNPFYTAAEIQKIFDAQTDFATSLAKTSAKERIEKLNKIERYLIDHEAELIAAMHKDFSKPDVESLLSESAVVISQIRFVRQNLKHWMRPKRVKTPLALTGTSSYLHYEPKGQILVIAPWNYPINLALYPLVYAIAAGCTVIVKPSEFTPNATNFTRGLINSIFKTNEVAVVEGDGQIAQTLTSLPFNHIFFTGSPQVGKLVMAAAAKNLASVTLELGGKSPAIVDETADIKKITERMVWGKYFNCGQTCIAPDYVLVHHTKAAAFTKAYIAAVKKLFGEDPAASTDFARVVNKKNFQRLKGLLDDSLQAGATLVIGGESDAEQRYIAPTLLSGVNKSMRIMQEEIFGPIMPMMTYEKKEDAIALINSFPKPLSMYINSSSRKNQAYFLNNTRAGSTLINDYLLSFSNPNLPMGGVNNSGIGKSLGHEGFIEFSNARSVIKRNFLDISMLYPPYNLRKTKLAKWIYKWM